MSSERPPARTDRPPSGSTAAQLIMGDRRGINRRLVSELVDAGFVVVSIDYRLAPETKLPEILDDVRDAFTWIRTQGTRTFGARADRTIVLGGSAGGYLTLMSGFLIEPRPAALVSFWGYGDIVGPWYSQPDPFYRRQPLVSEAEARAAVGRDPIAEPPALERSLSILSLLSAKRPLAQGSRRS